MNHQSDEERFLAYAAGQVARAAAALAEHTQTETGLCRCGRPWPCREVLWWTWVRSHYAPLLPPEPLPQAPTSTLIRPFVGADFTPASPAQPGSAAPAGH